MPYAYEVEGESSGAWKKGLLIAALVIFVPLLLLAGIGVFRAMTQTPEQRFDRQVAALPQVANFALPLKKHFPDEYALLRKNALSAEKGGVGAVAKASEAFFAGFMKRHATQARMASDEKLAAYLAALGEAYALGAKDAGTCSILMAGRAQAPAMAQAKNLDTLGKVASSYIEAAASGRDHPAKRAGIGDLDKLQVQAAMRRHGFTPQDMVNVSSVSANSGDPARPCKLLVAMITEISAMPAPQKARLTALFAEQS